MRRKPQFIFISHPIDNTGAPVVLLQIIEEYVHKYGSSRVRVIAPSVTKNQENFLKSLGVRPEKALHMVGARFIKLQLNLKSDDFVFINTLAIYDNYRDFVLSQLKSNRLKHAYWFIHEDKAQIPIINDAFMRKSNLRLIKSLASSSKLSLMYPSKRTNEEYTKILDVPGHTIQLRVEIPKKYKTVRKASSFETIKILLSGSSSDGRKGQVLLLSALQYFIDNFYSKNPDQYRTVETHLLAVGKNDYISKQIRWVANSALAEYVTIDESMPKEEAMALASSCNVVICCSLNETFGLYIAEGMLMGHVVLRNNVAGVDEQLIEGENGYLIDHTDIKDIAAKIEKIANKKTTNKQLAYMGKRSQDIMNSYTECTYISQIEAL